MSTKISNTNYDSGLAQPPVIIFFSFEKFKLKNDSKTPQ